MYSGRKLGKLYLSSPELEDGAYSSKNRPRRKRNPKTTLFIAFLLLHFRTSDAAPPASFLASKNTLPWFTTCHFFSPWLNGLRIILPLAFLSSAAAAATSSTLSPAPSAVLSTPTNDNVISTVLITNLLQEKSDPDTTPSTASSIAFTNEYSLPPLPSSPSSSFPPEKARESAVSFPDHAEEPIVANDIKASHPSSSTKDSSGIVDLLGKDKSQIDRKNEIQKEHPHEVQKEKEIISEPRAAPCSGSAADSLDCRPQADQPKAQASSYRGSHRG